MRLRSVLLIGSVAVVSLAGCSTSTSAPSSSPTTSPAATSASPSPTSVLPPIEVDGTSKAINATVGDVLVITVADVTKVSTDNPEILKVSQPRDDGSAQFNGGAEVLASGKAVLTFETADGSTDVTVHVTGG